MSNNLKNLLFEIGTEELPSSSIKEGVSELRSLLDEKLKEKRIVFSEIRTLATPRRLVAFVLGIEKKQQAKEKLITGPPKKIAFKPDGSPTEAAIGFARSLDIDVSKLQEISSNRGIFMGVRLMEQSRAAEEILPEILKEVILSFSFSKQMTWGDYDISFARPIRWIVALFGEKVIKFKIENINSSDFTYGIRSTGSIPLKIPKIKELSDYLYFLEEKGNVIIDIAKRRKIILDSIKKIENKEWNNRLNVVIDEELLDEVINLVEFPNVLIGKFPVEYLYIPREILIKAIQHHQRYFAVVDDDGNVTKNFAVVQNGTGDKNGEVISGNERVLKARLSDARFFYEEDRKHDFDFWYKKLEGVIFYSGLGSLYDKSRRIKKNCINIVDLLESNNLKKISPDKGDLSRASEICKCDLVTNLVVEFPELQGLVGKEYAGEKGEKPEIASAVFEHYLPRFAGDALPDTDTGAILAISDKIDTIAGMFLTGSVPSGSQDPFALRRKASGIILTALKKGIDVDIYRISEFALKQYIEKYNFNKNDINIDDLTCQITDFILARYRFRLERSSKRIDIFDAIISAGFYSVMNLDMRYRSIQEYISKKDIIKNIVEPFVRCVNITKNNAGFSKYKSEYLKEDSEKILCDTIEKKAKILNELLKSDDYDSALLELEDLAGYVNNFFDEVLVMDKDRVLRENRLNIVKKCADLYLLIADFSKIR